MSITISIGMTISLYHYCYYYCCDHKLGTYLADVDKTTKVAASGPREVV